MSGLRLHGSRWLAQLPDMMCFCRLLSTSFGWRTFAKLYLRILKLPLQRLTGNAISEPAIPDPRHIAPVHAALLTVLINSRFADRSMVHFSRAAGANA